MRGQGGASCRCGEESVRGQRVRGVRGEGREGCGRCERGCEGCEGCKGHRGVANLGALAAGSYRRSRVTQRQQAQAGLGHRLALAARMNGPLQLGQKVARGVEGLASR